MTSNSDSSSYSSNEYKLEYFDPIDNEPLINESMTNLYTSASKFHKYKVINQMELKKQ